MYAYEFFKGPGGSRDILLPENSEGLYALLPGLDNMFAAYDQQIYQGLGNWNPGASVQLLDSTQGLAAGNYAPELMLDDDNRPQPRLDVEYPDIGADGASPAAIDDVHGDALSVRRPRWIPIRALLRSHEGPRTFLVEHN